MNWFVYVMLGLTGVYSLAFLILAAGARRRSTRLLDDSELPEVSILVPARNERVDLPECIEALLKQDYPASRFEVVVIDDGSTDGTGDLITERFGERIRLIRCEGEQHGLTGKANALHLGILSTTSPVILLTDADCTPQPDWARTMATRLQAEGAGMVCGVTHVRANTLAEKIQTIDWMVLLGTTARAGESGFPITAMGNNMGLRRAAYDAIGGYPALPFSVTEDYVLYQAVNRHPDWTVSTPLDPGLMNTTLPTSTLRQAYDQRKRWTKGGAGSSSWIWLVMVVVFLANVLPLVGLFIVPKFAALALALMLASIGIMARRAFSIFGIRMPLLTYPAFFLYQLFYLTTLPFALLFSPRIGWKDRTF